MKNVVLKDQTVGVVEDDDVKEGDFVTVSLHNENGMPIEVSGEVIEVLD